MAVNENARLPKFIVLFEILTSFNPSHSSKACSPITSIVSGITTFLISCSLKKALTAISFTGTPLYSASISTTLSILAPVLYPLQIA